jgi:hypothetical protein
MTFKYAFKHNVDLPAGKRSVRGIIEGKYSGYGIGGLHKQLEFFPDILGAGGGDCVGAVFGFFKGKRVKRIRRKSGNNQDCRYKTETGPEHDPETYGT